MNFATLQDPSERGDYTASDDGRAASRSELLSRALNQQVGEGADLLRALSDLFDLSDPAARAASSL